MKIPFRILFALYATATFVATHWPNLRLDMESIPRIDIHIHMSVFGMWAFLLVLSGLLVPREAGDVRAERAGLRGWLAMVMTARAAALVIIVGALYAAFDESSQSLPGLNRTSAWDDYAADVGGVVVGALVGVLVGRRARRVDGPPRP